MPIGKSSIARAAKAQTASETVKPVEAKEAAPAVTEHVIANISPEVVEKVAGIKEETGKVQTKIVQVLDKMPDYLL